MTWAWQDYINYRWREVGNLIDHELREEPLCEYWSELCEIPLEMEEKIKWLCKEVIPIKNKTVELVDTILEHSIISSIHVQVVYLNIPFVSCISNSVAACFDRIKYTPIFSQMVDEYRIMWMASRRIQGCWRRCISNPNYFMCKRRLIREFKEF